MLSLCSRLHRRLSVGVVAADALAAAAVTASANPDVSVEAISPDPCRTFVDVVGRQVDFATCIGSPVADALKYLQLDDRYKPEGSKGEVEEFTSYYYSNNDNNNNNKNVLVILF